MIMPPSYGLHTGYRMALEVLQHSSTLLTVSTSKPVLLSSARLCALKNVPGSYLRTQTKHVPGDACRSERALVRLAGRSAPVDTWACWYSSNGGGEKSGESVHICKVPRFRIASRTLLTLTRRRTYYVHVGFLTDVVLLPSVDFCQAETIIGRQSTVGARGELTIPT